jgi:hypothetical protein
LRLSPVTQKLNYVVAHRCADAATGILGQLLHLHASNGAISVLSQRCAQHGFGEQTTPTGFARRLIDGTGSDQQRNRDARRTAIDACHQGQPAGQHSAPRKRSS